VNSEQLTNYNTKTKIIKKNYFRGNKIKFHKSLFTILFSLLSVFCSLFSVNCDLAPLSQPALSPLAEKPNEGTWYQIMPGSFYDSDGDGIGDLKGIIMKLDYLNDSHTIKHNNNMNKSDAGGKPSGVCMDSHHVNGIWLTPIHPSPSYHKYDVINYKEIDPQFGTMEEFRELLNECHKRGIKLVIDMVMNHTSEQHPWFQKALAEIRSGNPGRYASYYHFYYGATPPQRESVEYGDWYWEWDAYYDHGSGRWMPKRGIKNRFYRCWGKVMDGVWWEGSFWTGMPDLNWDSHHLREEFEDIVKFWLSEGLDGYRLDAVHYFYDWIDINQYERSHVPHNTHEKNIKMLKWFSDTCYAINKDVYLIGECWRDIDIIESYFRSGMNFFHFGASGSIQHTLNSGRGIDWANSLSYWNWRIKARNAKAVIASFLSNHDKDRSFYAMGGESGSWDSRPAPSMQGDDRRRFAASLNILSPGTPYIYYGEEIGLINNYIDYWSNSGMNSNFEFYDDPSSVYKRAIDDTDRRGPMWWSNSNRAGTANPPEHRQWSFDALTSRYGNGVEEQLNIEYSLLNHYIRLGNLKSRYPFIAWGKMELINTGNDNIAAWKITDTWKKSPTYENSVVVAHNADYGRDQSFKLSDNDDPKWIDGLCSRNLSWTPTIYADKTISLPPYYSAIIGLYEWSAQ